MLAEEKLREGDVSGAVAALKREVQQDPANGKYRVFLFQLLSVQSNWGSAATQLEVAGDLDPGNLAMVQAYREAIRCESERQSVFDGKSAPMIFGEPDRWVALLLQSLKLLADGQPAKAASLREEAFELAPGTSGTVTLENSDSSAFEWIADADSRIGPVMEVFMNGQYYWVPLQRIARLQFEAPADLRDFVWTAAHFTWANGGEAVGMIPTRYPGISPQDDPLVQLSRKTQWGQIGDTTIDYGVGQRMLVTDSAEYGLLDIRELELDTEAENESQTTSVEQRHGEGTSTEDFA
jgi:type VI secretion system protein ImpE